MVKVKAGLVWIALDFFDRNLENRYPTLGGRIFRSPGL
jgi:hypothetical protein